MIKSARRLPGFVTHLMPEVNFDDEKIDDHRSVEGKLVWEIVSDTCLPCLLRNADAIKYVPTSVSETRVLQHYLVHFTSELLECVSIKRYSLTEDEIALLNSVNREFCDNQLKQRPFNQEETLFKLDDLRQYYEFLDTCYRKLKLIALSDGQKSKCGFIRVNTESVVPYVTKNDLTLLPLFYFEGEDAKCLTDEMGVEIRGWELAYLKFCCKVQGIRNGMFGHDTCMMISLDVLKKYFPEETIFDDYWPSELQQSAPSLLLLKYGASHVVPQISPYSVTSSGAINEQSFNGNGTNGTVVDNDACRANDVGTALNTQHRPSSPSTQLHTENPYRASRLPHLQRFLALQDNEEKHTSGSSTSSASEQISVQRVRNQTYASSTYPSRKRNASRLDEFSTSARCPVLIRPRILSQTTPMVNKESLAPSATVGHAIPPNFSPIIPPQHQLTVQPIRLIRNRNGFLASRTRWDLQRGSEGHAANARHERSFDTAECGDVVDLTTPPSSPCSPATFDGEKNDDMEVMTVSTAENASYAVTTKYLHGAEWCVLNTVSVSALQSPDPFILLNDIAKLFKTTIPELEFKLHRILRIRSYRANKEQRKLLFRHQKIASIDEELLLISLNDFDGRFNHLKYLYKNEIGRLNEPQNLPDLNHCRSAEM